MPSGDLLISKLSNVTLQPLRRHLVPTVTGTSRSSSSSSTGAGSGTAGVIGTTPAGTEAAAGDEYVSLEPSELVGWSSVTAGFFGGSTRTGSAEWGPCVQPCMTGQPSRRFSHDE